MKKELIVFTIGFMFLFSLIYIYSYTATNGFDLTGNVISEGSVMENLSNATGEGLKEPYNESVNISFEENVSLEVNESVNVSEAVNDSLEDLEEMNGSFGVNVSLENVSVIENGSSEVKEVLEEENESLEFNEGVNVSEVVNRSFNESGNMNENLEVNDSKPKTKYIVGIKKPSDRKFFGLMKKSEEEVKEELQEEKEKVLKNVKNRSVDLGNAIAITEEDLDNVGEYEYVEEVRTLSVALTESTEIVEANESWLLEDFGDLNLTGLYETVCVIDTGINFSHPDLVGRNATACNFNCIDQACVEDCSIEDLEGHGTHVAGIVGANGGLKGVAPNVSMIGLKVFPTNSRSGATVTGIDSAIDWCVSNSESYNISVISMSLGSDTLYTSSASCESAWPTFTTSINNAFNKNISVVVSTGNGGSSTGISSPSCISKALPVGSTTKSDGMSSFGNRNSLVELLATGGSSSNEGACSPSVSDLDRICSTDNDGEGYIAQSGTSMSAPHVSGAIAILNQYLDSIGLNRTPWELEDVMNGTGLRIYDSSSSNYYSRISVYDSLLSLDSVAPNVSLVSPNDGNLTESENIPFVCNATDWQLANVTFKIWNTSGLVYNFSEDVTGTSNESDFGYNFSLYGDYSWNCFYSDSIGNVGSASSNYSITIGNFSVSLLSPANGTSTNVNDTNFSCRVRNFGEYDLDNVTFSIWNSSDLVYNESAGISNYDNTTTFNYTFLNETNYSWNCLAYDNVSNSTWADANFSISYDVTSPNIVLISPDETFSATGTTSVSFNFNSTDNLGFGECDLILDGASVKTESVSNGSNTIAYSVSAGSHTWNLNCSDAAGNSVSSATAKTFTINAASTGGTPGGGGSSGGGGDTTIENTTLEDADEVEDGAMNETEEDKTEDVNETLGEGEQEIGGFMDYLRGKSWMVGIVITLAILSIVLIEWMIKKGKIKFSNGKKNGKKSKK